MEVKFFTHSTNTNEAFIMSEDLGQASPALKELSLGGLQHLQMRWKQGKLEKNPVGGAGDTLCRR